MLLQFRYATISDAPMIAELRMQSLEDGIYDAPMAEPKRSRFVKQQEEDFCYELNNGDEDNDKTHTQAIIASVADNPLGYIMYRTVEDKATIKDLYVISHNFSENGKKISVGKALHAEMMKLNKHINTVDLCSYDKSVGFYEKIGYRRDEDNSSRMKNMVLWGDNLKSLHRATSPEQGHSSLDNFQFA